ncbi:hypothetical protein [Bradyrhizobium aeschynomenes]|uniref:hypothetical protein n=1 Tax=Bradyrhizobium aeschynomenes TaxID=2734909 RepID=UPI0015560897|nr:hypothetical protein [Bradyrhizobium aeschynomenes]NPV23064.1 hypothetical protein [Bradyrhizobium aeschynomenes]
MLVRRTIPAFLIFAGLPLAYATGAQRLPDTEVTRVGEFTAYLIDPTTRYDHGVLGDAIEAGGFVVERNGRRFTYRLPKDAVFEDRRVRLADLDGDGVPEAVIVKSYVRRGAAIAVFTLRNGIEPLAESPAIGAGHRWLNLVGVGNFTGTGEMTIAAVLTPHLEGSMRLYRLASGSLVEIARIDGFTNHILGTRNLDLARLHDIDRDGTPDVVLPSLDRRELAAVSFRAGKAVQIRRASSIGPIVAVDGVSGGVATVTLENGTRDTIDLNAGGR